MDFLKTLLEKYFLQPISIFVLILLEIVFLLTQYSDEKGFDNKFIAYTIIAFVFVVGYSIAVYYHNRVDKAKKGELGVLFVFHTENDSVYKEEKYKMKENFDKATAKFSCKIKPIFVKSQKIKNYDFRNRELLTNWLNKTNCVFVVDIVYLVEAGTNETNYELLIDSGVLSSDINDNNNRFIEKELYIATKQIKNQKFNNNNKLEKIKFTANSLSDAVNYVVGLVLLFNKEILVAEQLLYELFMSMDKKNVLYERVKTAYCNTCVANELYNWDRYYDTDDVSYLDKVEKYLETINELYPNTYGYCLDMAAIVMLKYNSVKKAKELIDKCKEMNKNDFWRYSDAFLTAYEGNDIYAVIRKYDKVKDSEYNVVRIIQFVEKKLEANKSKIVLYLALGLLYKQCDQLKLMKYNLAQFNSKYKYKPKDKNSKKIIEELLVMTDEQCLSCDAECISCKYL